MNRCHEKHVKLKSSIVWADVMKSTWNCNPCPIQWRIYSMDRCNEKHVKLSSMFSEIKISWILSRCNEKHLKPRFMLNNMEIRYNVRRRDGMHVKLRERQCIYLYNAYLKTVYCWCKCTGSRHVCCRFSNSLQSLMCLVRQYFQCCSLIILFVCFFFSLNTTI